MTYVSWLSDFALYLGDYLMDKCHNLDTGSMRSKDLPYQMYVGQWSTFHGPVILSYLKDYLVGTCHIWDIGLCDAKIYFIK